jgi:NAD-dependent SIR2 family protein deacetylase
MLGWKRIEAAEPNEAHWAVSLLERSGLVGGIVTQNVDGLHQKAGSENVTELHGNLREILCLDCGERTPRWELQKRLEEANPRWASRPFELGPDGNAEADDGELEEFQVMDCLRCGGLLKPNVVFFGEGVERAKVQEATEIVARSEALLVVGSSLAVFSGYRFVRQAHKAGLAIAVINIGETRADPVASAKLEGRVSDVLPLLAKHLMSNA